MKIKKESTRLVQLVQIAETPTWDGNLISKSETERLEKDGLISRARGFSLLSLKGLYILDSLGLIIK